MPHVMTAVQRGKRDSVRVLQNVLTIQFVTVFLSLSPSNLQASFVFGNAVCFDHLPE